MEMTGINNNGQSFGMSCHLNKATAELINKLPRPEKVNAVKVAKVFNDMTGDYYIKATKTNGVTEIATGVLNGNKEVGKAYVKKSPKFNPQKAIDKALKIQGGIQLKKADRAAEEAMCSAIDLTV